MAVTRTMRLMMGSAERAPGIPPDYYRRIYAAEQHHWWYEGMRRIAVSLLGDRWRAGTRLLDAGCGTGGFLRFALDHGRVGYVAGVDIGAAAIRLAGERVPEAELRCAPLHELPFPDGSFDLVVSNDVLQHVPSGDVRASLLELGRVLTAEGAVLLRTNGSRTLRVERDDWRAYDADTLIQEVAAAGLRCTRLTYCNFVPSLLAAMRGSLPHAPTGEHDGIPSRPPSRLKNAVGRRLLGAEARLLRSPGRSLPYGHTLFALARPA